MEVVEAGQLKGRTYEDALAYLVWQYALAGDFRAIQILLDRTEGPITQKIETTERPFIVVDELAAAEYELAEADGQAEDGS